MTIYGNMVGHPLPNPRKGLTMEGAIDMNGKSLTGLKVPEADNDAATKQYAENYANSLHKRFSLDLPAGGWTEAAPHKQTIPVAGILVTDVPHWSVVYASNVTTALAQKEAFAMVDDLDTAAGSVTFTCFEEKPAVNLTIQLEVNR